jgi:hypothetical protein
MKIKRRLAPLSCYEVLSIRELIIMGDLSIWSCNLRCCISYYSTAGNFSLGAGRLPSSD